jgi:hypothetical protein
MSLLAGMRKLWQSIAPRTRSDVEEEFRFTLDAYQEDLIRQGLPEAEARRKARIDLGQPAAQNETYRDAIGLRLFDELGGDIRYGLRALRRNPGFTAVAVLSLALGIGATTAMFSLIYAVLLHPFPYADADRIMNPHFVKTQQPDVFQSFTLSEAQLDDLRLAAPVDSVLGFTKGDLEISNDGLPEDIQGVYLTENAETFLGVRPLFGRMIEPFDAGHPVVVLNYRFWQRYFGGDPHAIGRTLEMDHAPYTIVGVMPRSFAFNDVAGVGDVYLPASLMDAVANGPAPTYLPWIKLRPHVTVATANAALEPIVREIFAEVYVTLGQVYGELGQKEKAVLAARDALRLEPNDPDAYLLLGRALQESGTLLEAVAAYEKSIELKPGRLHALAYLADAYLQLGRLEKAREILSHTSGVSLNDPKFQFFLAELYLKIGMREEASREHEALKRLDASLAEAFARLLGSSPRS